MERVLAARHRVSCRRGRDDDVAVSQLVRGPMPATLTVARMTTLKKDIAKAPGRPGFDAAVRVARRALAERIAANNREGRTSPGTIDIPIPIPISRTDPSV